MAEDGRSAPMVPVTFRMPPDEYEVVSARARDEGMKIGTFIRMQLLLAAGGFDQKHQSLLDRLDRALDGISRAERLAAIAVTSSALPKDANWADVSEDLERHQLPRILGHIKYAGALSTDVLAGVQKKKL